MSNFFQRLVVPNTHDKIYSRIAKNTKMDDICTHMNRTFCWEFSFSLWKTNKNRLVFSLHFSRSFESYVCAIYSSFFFNTSTPPDRQVLHAQWGRVIVSKSRMKRKNPPHYDEIARWCWPNKVQSRIQGLPSFFTIHNTHKLGRILCRTLSTHTHSRSILFCWALVSNGNRRINAAFNLCHFFKK